MLTEGMEALRTPRRDSFAVLGMTFLLVTAITSIREKQSC